MRPRPDAIVLDLDGTFYDLARLRFAMFLRMAKAYWRVPRRGVQVFRAVSAFRSAHTQLVRDGFRASDLSQAQLLLAAENCGIGICQMTPLIRRWMEEEPLLVLPALVRTGLREFLSAARNCGMALGVFSDYPVAQKLAAMKLDSFFDVVVSAQDGEVGVFKPDPRGLLTTLRRLGVPPQRSMYVGDRADADAQAAHNAGMDFVLLVNNMGMPRGNRFTCVRDFGRLSRLMGFPQTQ